MRVGSRVLVSSLLTSLTVRALGSLRSPRLGRAASSRATRPPFAVSRGGTGTGSSASVAAGAVRAWYDERLERWPVRTKCVSSGVFGALGDAIAQRIAGTAYAPRRTLAFVLVSACYFAPALHVWYEVSARAERWAARRLRWSRGRTALAQILFNQTVFSALVNAGFFYALALATLIATGAGGRGPVEAVCVALREATARLRASFVAVMLANWVVWPLPSLWTIWCVPLRYRVLVTNAVALVWKCVLSLMTAPALTIPA